MLVSEPALRSVGCGSAALRPSMPPQGCTCCALHAAGLAVAMPLPRPQRQRLRPAPPAGAAPGRRGRVLQAGLTA